MSSTGYPRNKTLVELAEEASIQGGLHMGYRTSFFKIVSHFGPFIRAVIAHRHRQRDLELTTEAEKVIAMHATDSAGAGKLRTKLNVQLELETALCSEYRDSYFAIINLVGKDVFQIDGDPYHQLNGILEADAAKLDDSMERIRNAAQS